jgi:hypothetical protein
MDINVSFRHGLLKNQICPSAFWIFENHAAGS